MDEAAGGPPIQLPVHGLQGDVAEVGGYVAGLSKTRGVFLEQGQDAVSAPGGRGGVPVVQAGQDPTADRPEESVPTGVHRYDTDGLDHLVAGPSPQGGDQGDGDVRAMALVEPVTHLGGRSWA